MTLPLVKSFHFLRFGVLCLTTVLVLALVMAFSVLAQEPPPPAVSAAAPVSALPTPPARGLLLAPLLDGPKVYSEITGAKKTVLVPAYQDTIGTRIYSAKAWGELGVKWEDYVREAMVHADALIEAIQPEIVRNPSGVAEYAILQSEDPYLTSVLFSKKFLAKFSDTFGKELQVVPLARGRIYVFPALGRPISEYGLADEFANQLVPLTLEVFLITRDGAKVIGEIER